MRGLQPSLLLWALWCLINTICIRGDRGELRSVSQGTRGDSVRSVPSSLEDFTPGPGTMLQLMPSGLFNEHIVNCTVNSHFTSWKLHKQEFFCSKLKLLWQMCLASLLTGDGMNRAGSSGFQSSPGYCCQEGEETLASVCDEAGCPHHCWGHPCPYFSIGSFEFPWKMGLDEVQQNWDLRMRPGFGNSLYL